MAIWTAFTLGLLGSFHCAAMCGPLAMAIPKSGKYFYRDLYEGLLYNFGRVSTYTLFGLISGFLGFQLNLMGLQNLLSYFIGGTLIITSVIIITRHHSRKWLQVQAPAPLQKGISRLMQHNRSESRFLLGFLNGLLPCGFVYVALAASLVSGGVAQSVLYMLFFGLGTIPVMITLFMAPSMLSLNMRKRMNSLIPVFSLLIGILILLRPLPVHPAHMLLGADDHEEEMCTYPSQDN
jgi:hypothetical protein